MSRDYCQHWECILDRVGEMALVADVIERRVPALSNKIRIEAADLLHKRHIHVRCRHVPRPSQAGAPLAPLPPRRAP